LRLSVDEAFDWRSLRASRKRHAIQEEKRKLLNLGLQQVIQEKVSRSEALKIVQDLSLELESKEMMMRTNLLGIGTL
jgi:plasmid stability protein